MAVNSFSGLPAIPASYGFTAGKNKIINGDFNINQRNFSSVTTDAFGFDRWKYITNTGTVTYSAQTFTAGTAPVSGYEAKNYARIVTTGQSGTGAYTVFIQPIESVRSFANQIVTVSFWAKSATGTPKIAVELNQIFGTGGSPSAENPTLAGSVTLSTSWTRYSVSVNVPTISGKTIGTNNNDNLALNLWLSAGSDFNARTNSLGIQSNTFDIWGVQVEAGSTATAFQTATGTLAGELAACKRYYQYFERNGTWEIGQAYSGTQTFAKVHFESEMRVPPTVTLGTAGKSTGQMSFLTATANFAGTVGTHTAQLINSTSFEIQSSGYGASTFVAGNSSMLYANGNMTVYTASAEL